MKFPSFKAVSDHVERFKWISEVAAQAGGLSDQDAASYGFMAQRMMIGRKSKIAPRLIAHAQHQELWNQYCPKVFIPRQDGPISDLTVLGLHYAAKVPISIRDSLLPEGVVIVGTKGAGKTQAISSMVAQTLAKSKPCTWIDFRADAERFFNKFPSEMIVKFTVETEPKNFACPFSNRCRQTIPWFVSKLGWYDNLPGITRSEATRVLLQLDAGRRSDEPPLSISQMASALKFIGEKETRQSLLTFARSIKGLASMIGHSARIRSFKMPRNPLMTILSWQGLQPRLCAFQLGFQIFVKELLYGGQGFSPGVLRELIVIDEALNIASQDHGDVAGGETMSPIRSLATKARPYGIGFIIASQLLAALDSTILGNWAVFICFRLSNLKDARIAAEMLRKPAEAVSEIMSLPTRVAFVLAADWPEAVKVEFPTMELGEYPDPAFVDSCNQPFLTELEKSTTYSKDTPEAIEPIRYEDLVQPAKPAEANKNPKPEQSEFVRDFRAFAEELEKNPAANVKTHTKILAWSASKFNTVQRKLKAQGFIVSTTIKTSKGPGRKSSVLSLTSKGKRELGIT